MITTLDLSQAEFAPSKVVKLTEQLLYTFEFESQCGEKDWFNPGEVDNEREEIYAALNDIHPKWAIKADNIVIRYLARRANVNID